MRLIPFEFNNQQTYILEFGNYYIRIRKDNESSYIQVNTPYTNEDVDNLDYIQKGDVLFLVDGKHSPKQLERLSATSWQLVDYQYSNGPFKELEDKTAIFYSLGIGLNEKYYVSSSNYTFTESDIDKKFNIETYFKAQTLVENNVTVNVEKISDTILVGSSWLFETKGTWAGTVTIQISEDGSNWKDYKVMSSTITNNTGSYNANITGDFDDILFVRIVCNLTQNSYFQYTFQSIGFYENISFIIHSIDTLGNVRIDLEEYDSSIVKYANNFCLTSPLSYDNAEPLQKQAWNEGDYPKHITFYQDRLVFANSNSFPFTIWATETSNYYSFKIHAELLDSDSIQTNVAGDGLNEITSLVSLMSLIAFTENGVYRTGIDVWNATGNFALTRQSAGGGSAIRPVSIDNSCIYVRPTKDNIRDFFYQYQIDAYAGDQLDILARNLFENKKIKQLAYQEQDKTIWVLFEDGTLAYCVYMKEQEVLGWNEFVTDGKVVSIATIMSDFNDTLYLAVERRGQTYIEKLDRRFKSKDIKDQIFVDSAVVYTQNGQYFDTITGLNHLEGREVSVLADGIVIENQIVTNGTISLNKLVTKAIVGIPYETLVETLDVNYAGNGQATTGDKRKVVSAIIDFVDSCDCSVGTSNGEIDRISFREENEDENTAIPVRTKKYYQNITSSHNMEEHIIIKQDKPLPFTITDIKQRVTMGDK